MLSMKKFIFILLLTWFSFSSLAIADNQNIQKATFAGGCFWCMEEPFDQLKGVISTTSGYTGGSVSNPTYKQVSAGNTGHAEAVEVKYDANQITYEKLLNVFWRNIDPTVQNKQFCDTGNQYRSEIFYHNDQQKKIAQASKAKIQKQLNKNIFTQITPAKKFYPAEDYHQNYYKNQALLYKYYRYRCGRDQRLQEIWGLTP